MDLLILASTCKQNKYCTNCPIRKDCPIRPKFYSKTTYNENIVTANARATQLWLSMGGSLSSAAAMLNEYCREMDTKRETELKLHPTYSHD